MQHNDEARDDLSEALREFRFLSVDAGDAAQPFATRSQELCLIFFPRKVMQAMGGSISESVDLSHSLGLIFIDHAQCIGKEESLAERKPGLLYGPRAGQVPLNKSCQGRLDP